MSGILYLIPAPMGGDTLNDILPADVIEIAKRLTHFVVENAKTTRAHLKMFGTPHELRSLQMDELSEHTKDHEVFALLKPLLDGIDVGLMSEAGCPGVADPGARLVQLAHQRGIKVVPLVGPSSLLLALMASGANGQKFRFNGYLPSDATGRVAAIRQLEATSTKESQAELFIETPYRNGALFQALLASLKPGTRLTVACDITLPNQEILTLEVGQWKKKPEPVIHKRPTVFIIQA
ncbi:MULTISPECIES: SAM-dependent methyltransferase [Deefgea]|uniref:SAM-dependent methyltransferase n=1 Tax=Deefgea chitinilytica TaxID=570276 RepID=A0ABS2CDC9_9NEIS|nr:MULTISPECIES: SAM-dependent methyltransferase [Deefgea]MBM5572047.1 SAM-dependent methyltransferase [Deefgea chitinilytica]MBM9889282.1 SAM-dependent methyltransferase [Deefgea sp. CFH1-16]